ncbi:MAG: NAD(P)-dependent alcohol dehydrogenase [Bacteroidales bacterium]|jgi:NADPH:quinone reductase-like Zn-dependent oxidoreductase|nr:NAD(P)-dependent alcohol dehydrogenase [Bacteroidales bacterium]
MQKMKAVVCTKYGSPEVLKVTEFEKPTPKEDEILVRLYATAVTSSDTYLRRLNVLPFYMRIMAGLFVGFGKPRNPILGMIISGEVEKTGSNVTRFKKGDKIFGTTVISGTKTNLGTYAEYKCLPEQSYVSHIPSNLDFIGAAAIAYGGSIALWCLEKTAFPCQSAESANNLKILIYGASGSVGTSLIQIAKACGAEVTGVCSTSNFELVKSLGATYTIDYSKEDFTERDDRWDIIIDAVGFKKSQPYIKNYRRILAPHGKFHSVDQGSPKNSIEYMNSVRQLAEKDILKPVIDKIYTIDEIIEAHEYVDKGHKKGNVVIRI